MVSKLAFEVVSEFVFEEAVALVATNTLTSAVEKLSKKTDDAIFGVLRLGTAYAKNFITGGAGFLGFMGASISSSEKFKQTQIEIANTMLANRFTDSSGIIGFNKAMGISEKIMKNISKEAKAANLTTFQLANSAKLFANFLAPKGLAGNNMGNAIELARVSVKAGAALNIDQSNIQQQIANAITGNLSKGTLFGTRLFAESGDAISGASGGQITNIKQFNKASGEMRLKVLIAGLDKLAGGTEIINARAKTLTNRFARLKDVIFGTDSILRGFGDTLTSLIGPVLDIIIKQVETKGRLIISIFNNTFKKLGETPEKFLLSMQAFAGLHGDVTSAGTSLRFLAMSIALLGLAAQITPLRNYTLGLIRARGVMGKLTLRGAKLSRVFQGLMGKGFITRMLMIAPTFLALIGVFQIFSRAANKIQIQFYKFVDIFGTRFLKQTERFIILIGLLFQPFNLVVELFSDLVGHSVLTKVAFEGVLKLFKGLNTVLGAFVFIVQGVFIIIKALGAAIGSMFSSIFQVFTNPAKLVSGDFLKSIFTNAFGAADSEIDKSIKSIVNSLLNPESGEKAVAKNIVNANIKNTFNIKEKIEPDRIAFTLADQLKKLSENKRSAFGSPLISSGGA